MKRRSGIKRCSHALSHAPECRPGRPLCRWMRADTRCNCASVCSLRGPIPHRYGSRFGRWGICEHHPDNAVRMYEILDTPIRKVR